MGVIAGVLGEIEIPKMVPVRQHFDRSHIPAEAIPEVVFEQLGRTEIADKIKPGMEIAITVGSRGVANVPLITKAIADFVKSRGAVPFVVPAMGSHGGATAEGQRQVIEGYGVTEEFIGCEIRSSMDTVQIGTTPDHKPVRLDRHAAESDGIIVCGRVKPHTGFRGPYESGIMKMMAIGLGKRFGAELIHADGFGRFREYIPMFGKVILAEAPVLCGLALLENAYDQTKEIVSLMPTEIMTKEPELLLRAKEYMPRILVDSCDVLIVDEMGKDISGDGMDPNISGRFPTPYAEGGIDAKRVAVLDLTEESHGNACGIGLADITTKRLFNKMDLDQTYINAITNTVVGEMMIPMMMDTDKMAIQAAIKTCIEIDRSALRIVHIRNTMEMEYLEISEALIDEIRNNSNVEILGAPMPMSFDENGNLF